MRPNTGNLPDECLILDDYGNVTGHRQVMVRLFNGMVRGPWPSAGGRPHPTKWNISRPPHPYQIEKWEIV